ncbi:MAG: polysaccharide biosynthesis/export family protein [Muribaculaceae bacterium]|nr:polysaccharide biosynthesis/export family protein [Muribaculaceae bacterium]
MKPISRLILSLSVAAAFCSCSSTKQSMTLFGDIPADAVAILTAADPDYSLKIQPDDELSITVTSIAPEATAMYNLPLANIANRGTKQATANISIQTFIVDAQGNIDFPILGTLHVSGMTCNQVSDFLKEKISAEVDDPIVRVQILNFAVNVIGEVKIPGRQPITKEQYSILDAIAMAGDISEYGRRDNVLVIRQEGDSLIYHRFDLNDSKSLNSPFFRLKQNDVVYVEPTKVRSDNARYNTFNSYKLSVISTLVSSASVIASLVIALTR